MPLNYSKWDKLELSDDSDIEGHPNVDHKSLVRWTQRAIHEKRAERSMRIADLEAEIKCNDVLLPRLRTITEEVHGAVDGPAEFSKIVEQLKTNPSPDAPETNAPRRLTYDEMVLSLLLQVYADAKEKGADKNDDRLREALIANLKGHVAKLGEQQEKLKKELEHEIEERDKKITSENVHDGWESHYVPPKPEPKPIEIIKPKSTKTSTTTSIEVLNPKGVEAGQAAEFASKTIPSSVLPSESDDDSAELPDLTPNLEAFSRLPLWNFEKSYEFLKAHRDVYVSGASDALLLRAFKAEADGDTAYAYQCVHQSCLLNICSKIGKDGVRLFFQKMTNSESGPHKHFKAEVDSTYSYVRSRSKVLKEEAEASKGVETLQLQADGDNQQIRFNIPDGPPPEKLVLEGKELEGVDVEEVRQVLQATWDAFNSLSEEMQEALKSQDLGKVNQVLGKMNIEEAEYVVTLLGDAGIMGFSGIRDETGLANADNDLDNGNDADEEDESQEEIDAEEDDASDTEKEDDVAEEPVQRGRTSH